MKGQDSQNTYCQPGTSIDPATPEGLKFGQGLGGINAVKQTYDQINRLANDNTKSNDERSTAVKQCYGVSFDSMYASKNPGPTQVFAVSGPGGQSYKYTKDQAQQVCAEYGSQVATSAQLVEALEKGADWCFTGWLSDTNIPQYPITTSIGPGCGNGRSGIQSLSNSDGKAGVNCYGPKPGIDDYSIGTILPFSQSKWDQPGDGKSKCTFDANKYAAYYPDLSAAFGNNADSLKNHYLQYGMNEGRTPCGSSDPNCKWNPNDYLNANPDVVDIATRNNWNPVQVAIDHYKGYGINEGRSPCPSS
jgi:hypothetical protein